MAHKGFLTRRGMGGCNLSQFMKIWASSSRKRKGKIDNTLLSWFNKVVLLKAPFSSAQREGAVWEQFTSVFDGRRPKRKSSEKKTVALFRSRAQKTLKDSDPIGAGDDVGCAQSRMRIKNCRPHLKFQKWFRRSLLPQNLAFWMTSRPMFLACQITSAQAPRFMFVIVPLRSRN